MRKLKSVLFTTNTELKNNMMMMTERFNLIEIVDVYQNIGIALEKLNQANPDILFIDMDDKEYGAISLMDVINKPPFIIGISSEIKDHQVLLDAGFHDFWISPDYNYESFCRKMSKLINLVYKLLQSFSFTSSFHETEDFLYGNKRDVKILKDSIFVKYRKISKRVKYDDILFIRNIQNALKIVLLNEKSVYHNSTLKKFLALLPENKFIRINNSTIINVNKIEEYQKNTIYINGEKLTISRIYSEELKRRLL